MALIKPLLLAGGRSSRMGTRKELLSLEGNEPMYKQLVSVLHMACPESDMVYLSLRNREAAKAIRKSNKHAGIEDDLFELPMDYSTVHIIYDHEAGNEDTDIGPAAGLLSAHHHDPAATWLVAACDYPFLTAAALQCLRKESEGASITCFSNAKGFCEPLLGIWTPEALRALRENVEQGICGPSAVVRRLCGRTIRPVDERWLFNANSWDEWKQAIEMRKTRNLVDPKGS